MAAAAEKRKFDFWVEEDWLEDVATTAKQIHLDKSKFARRALDVALARVKAGLPIEGEAAIKSDDPLLDSFRAPFLTKAPCGPWEEALDHASFFTISQDTADELGARDGDVFVRTVGDSNEGIGIPDGMLLLMRPLLNRAQPRRNEVALVQIVDDSGDYLATIKRWQPGTPPTLIDGGDKEFPTPEGTREIIPVAVALGIIGRI